MQGQKFASGRIKIKMLIREPSGNATEAVAKDVQEISRTSQVSRLSSQYRNGKSQSVVSWKPVKKWEGSTVLNIAHRSSKIRTEDLTTRFLATSSSLGAYKTSFVGAVVGEA